ncbi:MAG: OmpA family protein [Candidatus Thiodiazotropha sp. (ex Monitilora ramsayi)]|nr:OmpA family protein [Candidatus Thiodiazotropha sp. (ex Monitilora ramsayi)]
MKTIKLILTLLSLFLLFSQSTFAAKKIKTDHPLVTPYTGSKIYSKKVTQFDEYSVFKGWDKTNKQYNTQELEGKITKILYKNPPERSILELYRNYQSALEKDGVTLLYECNQKKKTCVDGYVGAHLRQQFGIHAIGNKDGRYMFARLQQEGQVAYIVLAVGNQSTDVHVIEMKQMETGQVALNVSALTEDLDRQGYVVVEGIYFDTNKTDLKAESKPAIDQVVKLLSKRPGLKLYVVGHTDMQGSLGHNISLSEGRAKSVVETLVKQHAIAADRLEGKGVGPLAPVASNSQDSGRSKNRRVVLVQR